jgi:hypothetical protein
LVGGAVGLRWHTLFYRRSGNARHAGVFRKTAQGSGGLRVDQQACDRCVKKELFDRLVDHLAMLASELERAIEVK